MNNLIHFDEKIPVDSSTYIVRCGYLWGLVNDGKFIMKPIYDYIWVDLNNAVWATYNGKPFVVDSLKQPALYDYIERLDDEHNLIYKDEFVGVFDANMKEIITPTFFKIIKHSDIFWCRVDKELDLYILYTTSGEAITHEPINYNPNNFPIINSLTGWNIIGENYQYLLPVNAQLIKREYDWHDPQKKDPVGIITAESCQLLYLSIPNKYIDIAYSKIKQELSLFLCYRGEAKFCFKDFLSLPGDYHEDNFVDIYDQHGSLIVELDLSAYSIYRLSYYNEQLILRSNRNQRFGVMDKTGIIIPFRYNSITRRGECIIAEVHYKLNDTIIKEYDVYNSTGKCIIHGLLDSRDKLIGNPDYNDNIIIQCGNRFTAYTTDGKYIRSIDGIEALGEFSNHGLAIAKSENGDLGLVDTNLTFQTYCIYSKFRKSDISDNIVVGVCNSSHYIFIKDGKAHRLLYNQIEHGKYDFQLVSKDTVWDDNIRWGVVNNEGLEIIGCLYLKEEIIIVDADTIVIPAYNNVKIAVDKYGNDKDLAEQDLEAILPTVKRRNSKGQSLANLYTQFDRRSFGYQGVRNQDGKWGFIDSNNDEITPFIYDSVYEMSEHGLACVKTKDGNGIIDTTGSFVVQPGYRGADPNHSFITPEDIDQCILVIKDGKYGLFSPGFVEVIPPIYDKLIFSTYDHYKDAHYNIETGYIHACKDGKYGIFKINGNQVITLVECIYDKLEYFTNPTSYYDYNARYEINNKEYFIGRRCIDGKSIGEVINSIGEIVNEFNAELNIVYAHEGTFVYSTCKYKYGNNYHIIINHSNILSQYDRLGEFRGRYINVIRNSKYGVYDTITGNEIISCKYNSDLKFAAEEDIVPAEIAGKFGFINIRDQIIIEPTYENAKVFTEGLAAVSLNGKWGYIDLQGRQIIPFIYEAAFEFSSGLAVVKKGELYGYIDQYNNVIIPFIYTDAGNFSRGKASVCTKDYRAEITPRGIEIECEQIIHYSSSDDDYDYARDSWDAMTDGQYGDYDGYDGDYDFMGY